MVDVVIRPRGPYSLALTARHAGDAPRRFREGVFEGLVRVGDHVERGAARQHPDGSLRLVADSGEAIERLRFSLALDDDHSEFLRRFRNDPMLGPATRRLAGLRQVRVPTVAHALLRALCGQLIKSLSAIRGRRVEGWETEELLAPYGEWAGLAGVYMLSAWARGLLTVSPAERRAA